MDDLHTLQSLTAPLPVELLNHLCTFCDIQTLKSLRQVSHVLTEVAAPQLFHTLYAILLPESMNKVKDIANHPRLSTLVKEFVYIGDRLNPDWIGDQLENNPFVNTRRYRKYRATVEEQSYYISIRAEEILLSLVLGKLPNLQAFELASVFIPQSRLFNLRHSHSSIPIMTKFVEETDLTFEIAFKHRFADPDHRYQIVPTLLNEMMKARHSLRLVKLFSTYAHE